MKRLIYLLLLLVGANAAFSQLEISPIYTAPIQNSNVNNARQRVAAFDDTLQLPFLENFLSMSTNTNWQENRGVYVNNHFAVNQPSVGVATLDGIDGLGTPYFFSPDKSAAAGVGDYMISKNIDLSSVDSSDGTAFQFFWEQGTPNDLNRKPIWARGERLRLFFKDSLDNFKQVWPSNADVNEIIALGKSDTFYLKNILIDPIYLHDGFQFKFEYYGIMSGNYAVFNVDNIYINKGIAKTVAGITSYSIPQDYGISKVPSNLLKTYTSVPVSHFTSADETILRDTIEASVYSIDTLFVSDKDSSIVISNVADNSVLIAEQSSVFDFYFVKKGQPTELFWAPDLTDLKNRLNALMIDTLVQVKTTISINTPDSIKVTDSASSVTHFKNYYAYDDGTIEAGLGIRGVGEFVQAYDFIKSDVVHGFYVFFPKYGLNLENTFIVFNVYSSLENVDGETETIRLLAQNGVVEYQSDSTTLNKFVYVPISNPINISAGRYYFGISQNSENRILLGLDYSNNRADDIFFREFTNPWSTFTSEGGFGSVALRPVMGSNSLGLFDNPSFDLDLKVFPNPSSNRIYFDREVSFVEVYNSLGLFIDSEEINGDQMSINNLNSGVYILKIQSGNKLYTQKLFVE